MTTERRYFTLNSNIKPVPEAAPEHRGRWRWVLLLLSVLLVLVLAASLIFPRTVNKDRIVRYFRYMGLRDQEGYGRISFEGSASNVYAGFDDGFLVGSENGLTLYSLDGEQKAFIQGTQPAPILRTGETVSLLFSPGSSNAAAVGSGGTTLLDGTISGTFVDADLSADGYVAYITAESGNKAVATVLNPKMNAIYRFSSRTRYLNACGVSPEGEYLAVASLEEKESIYRSGVTILRTDEAVTDLEREESSAVRLELGNRVVYELRFLDEARLLAVTQDELVFLNTKGEILREFSLRDGQLIDYSLSEDGWLVLALSENGGNSRVLTLDASGKTLAERTLPDRVRDLSAAEGYAAVLTDQYLQIYDRRLNDMDRDWDTLSAVRVIARSDGTALLVESGSTKLFIP